MSFKDDIDNTIANLKEQRDEIQLQMHLASMEVKDEWEELEEKWEDFVARNKQLQKEVEPALGDIKTAMLLLRDELKNGYARIRKAL